MNSNFELVTYSTTVHVRTRIQIKVVSKGCKPFCVEVQLRETKDIKEKLVHTSPIAY